MCEDNTGQNSIINNNTQHAARLIETDTEKHTQTKPREHAHPQRDTGPLERGALVAADADGNAVPVLLRLEEQDGAAAARRHGIGDLPQRLCVLVVV